MSMRRNLLATASALVLLGAASGAALADDQIVQNGWTITMMNPDHVTFNQSVTGGEATDGGSTRTNDIKGHYSNNMLGISHDQQNNGNNNAMAVGANVLVNTAELGYFGPGDITQNLWIRGVSGDATYNNVVDTNDPDAFRNNHITNAYQDVQGVFAVQQNNGDGNVMAIGDVVSANLGPAFGQAGDPHDDSTQKVRVSGRIGGPGDAAGNTTTHTTNWENPNLSGERTNLIDDFAFKNFRGLLSVQQNNGNGNIIQVGNAVIGDIDTDTDNGFNFENAAQYVKADGHVYNSTATSSGDAGPSPHPADRDNKLTSTFRGPVKGIINVQQNNGDNNAMNVANAVRFNLGTYDDIDDVSTSSVAAVGTSSGNMATDTDQNRVNRLTGLIFYESRGLITVQQNNGDNSAMNSAAGVVATLYTEREYSDDVMAGAMASASVSGNNATATDDVDRLNTINSDVFNSAAGIVTVQQNNGDNNVINASKSVVAAIGAEVTGFTGDIMADTALSASVTGNTATVEATNSPPGYANVLTNSFQNFTGVKTTQQNNGSNNAIQSAVTVVANIQTAD